MNWEQDLLISFVSFHTKEPWKPASSETLLREYYMKYRAKDLLERKDVFNRAFCELRSVKKSVLPGDLFIKAGCSPYMNSGKWMVLRPVDTFGYEVFNIETQMKEYKTLQFFLNPNILLLERAGE